MLWNSIISLSYALTLHMEIVRSQNTRAIPEFYPHENFHEGANFEKILKNSEIFEFSKKEARDDAPALRVLAREPG